MRPTFALPIDIFRVLVGLLSFVYFVQLIVEVPDFSSPEGLIDHNLHQEIFWYTRWSLFQVGMAAWHFYLIFLLAALAACMVILGWRPKLATLVLYVIAVSTYRWNFLVIYLDDGMMHLVLLWLLLLPIGRTLLFQEWLTAGKSVWRRWRQTTISSAAVYGFLANLALLYLTAGLWKWTSPMWRDGSAVYAGLKMPISRAPDFWQPEHLYLLTIANYGVLVVEPLLALMVILPKHHPLKWALVLSAVGLHGGIIFTLGISYANFACLFGLVIVLRGELMAGLHQYGAGVEQSHRTAGLDLPGKLSLVLVVMLALAMIGDALPWWRLPSGLSRKTAPDGSSLSPGQVLQSLRDTNDPTGFLKITAHGNPMYIPLWFVGVAQEYRLFDWIDDVNYASNYEIYEDGAPPVLGTAAAHKLFPVFSRGILLQAYVNDVRWDILPPSESDMLKRSLFTRLARRYCRNNSPRGRVEVFVTVEKIVRENLLLNHGHRERLLAFECKGGEPSLSYMRALARVGG